MKIAYSQNSLKANTYCLLKNLKHRTVQKTWVQYLHSPISVENASGHNVAHRVDCIFKQLFFCLLGVRQTYILKFMQVSHA